MSFENIVMTYPHPHVLIAVQDNTFITETFLEEESPVRGIQVGAFAEGRDNKLLYVTQKSQFIEEFGTPNYRLYGQAGYNVARALGTGYAGMHVMRVLPDDAEYANVVIMARYKVETLLEEQIEQGLKPKFVVSYVAKTITGATSLEELKLKVEELEQEGISGDGFYEKPILVHYAAGRGDYGRKFRMKFVDATNYEDPENTMKTYRMDVLKMEQKLVRKESIYGGLNVDAFNTTTGRSLYLEDIVMDPETGSNKVGLIINDAVINHMLEVYNTAVEEPITIDEFDPFFGRLMDGTQDPNMTFEEAEEGAVNLSSIDGYSLHGGSDGSFAVTTLNRQTKIDECIIKALNGDYDKSIRSRFASPADFMLDANYSDDVKKALARLAVHRKWDAKLYLDAGLISTTTELIEWLETMKTVNGPNIVKELHHYKVRDTEFTGKTIPVTTTYFLAELIPNHFKSLGIGEPMVREHAIIKEAVPGSFLPVIDPIDDDIKKQIYLLRGNCYETLKYNTFQRTTALTSQLETSDRSDEFNDLILQLAVRTAEDILNKKLYKLAEEEDRIRYQKEAERLINYILGGLIRSVSVEFVMSAEDELKQILRLRLRIVFKTIVKRGIVEVYIDPRATA